jgi:hypothetical protein
MMTVLPESEPVKGSEVEAAAAGSASVADAVPTVKAHV